MKEKSSKLQARDELLPSNNSKEQLYQQLEIQITKGSQKGKIVNLESGDAYQGSNTLYKAGNEVVIAYAEDSTGG